MRELRQEREADNQKSLLLKLPGELRNRIYEFVLLEGRIIDVDTGAICHFTEKCEDHGHIVPIANAGNAQCASQTFRAHLSITQACRQIRKETLKTFYASNTFFIKAGAKHDLGGVTKAEVWVRRRPLETHAVLLSLILQQNYSSGFLRKIAMLDIDSRSIEVPRHLTCNASRCTSSAKRVLSSQHFYKRRFASKMSAGDKLIQVMDMFFSSRFE